MDFIDTVLIMIYSGLRPGELLLIKTVDVNINERIIRGGIKTKAGKNRIIPINNKIADLISKRIIVGNDYLITNNDELKKAIDLI